MLIRSLTAAAFAKRDDEMSATCFNPGLMLAAGISWPISLGRRGLEMHRRVSEGPRPSNQSSCLRRTAVMTAPGSGCALLAIGLSVRIGPLIKGGNHNDANDRSCHRCHR